MQRVMKINKLGTINDDAGETVRSTLVIGINWTANTRCTPPNEANSYNPA